MSVKRCALCKEREALWACQPYGPDERTTFALCGSHYRGFPVVAVCDACKERIEREGYHAGAAG